MKEKQFTVCGVRDGGMISHRKENPFVVNTFFSILNFKEIEAIWNKKEVLKNQYIDLNEFRDDLSDLPFQYYITSVYEPYYCFYFWLRRKGKQILFLDSKMDDDGISNYVYYNQKEILCHTWYARSFGTNEKHTKRIELILEKTIQSDIETKESIVKTVFYKKKAFALDQKIKKYYKRICIKLGR